MPEMIPHVCSCVVLIVVHVAVGYWDSRFRILGYIGKIEME